LTRSSLVLRSDLRLIVRVVALSLVLLTRDVSIVSAQTPTSSRVRGPFAGLFGGGPGLQNAQSMDFRTSLFGVWQDVVVPRDFDPTLLDPTFDRSGTFGGAIGQLDYTFNRHSQNSTLFAVANGWVSDYSVTPDVPQYGVLASGGFSHIAHLTRRLLWNSSATTAYSPFFNVAQIPIGTSVGATSIPFSITPGLGVAGVNASNVQANGTTGLTQLLSRRSSIAANLFVQQEHFFSQSDADLTQLGSQVAYNYRLFRHLSFHVGYQQMQGRFGNRGWSAPVRYADFGLDYGDGLTFQLTRRTTLAVTASLGSARTVPGGTQYRVLGSAGLTHLIGRTWVASLLASRGLGFVAAFQEPALIDSVTASLGGQLATRLHWVSSAGLTRGYIGLDQSRHYDALYGTSALSLGLTRHISAFAQYFYNRNRLPAGSSPLLALTDFDRQTASVGLSLFQPIFNTQRTR
jgi:hypothetical protein